ncbi:hypothetical protein HPB50_008108 [Hyalomma asiaticum]|uniref:Uncharacterized protein n=1 Tax=Hyalomma asiaticum TaxID=266040 RepID=A0ACB7SA55_HYAAI|nr:hypothetical protein HPB50_008108 [Hyalomma asiaticum]
MVVLRKELPLTALLLRNASGGAGGFRRSGLGRMCWLLDTSSGPVRMGFQDPKDHVESLGPSCISFTSSSKVNFSSILVWTHEQREVLTCSERGLSPGVWLFADTTSTPRVRGMGFAAVLFVRIRPSAPWLAELPKTLAVGDCDSATVILGIRHAAT